MELTAIALWLNTALAGLDESVAIAVHRLYEIAPGFFTPFLTLITYMGKGGIFLILLSFALMLFRPTRRYGTAMLLGITIGALITNLTVKPLVARPRPYTWDGSVYQKFWEQLGRHTDSDKSFPSGHMTAAMAASTAVFLRGRKKISWTAFLFAFFMGVSRIYLSVHYATDVLGGVITGGVGGVCGYYISKIIPEGFYDGDIKALLPGSRPPRQPGRHQSEHTQARREVVIDGERFSDLTGFFAEMTRLFGSPEGTPLQSLDAFNDALRGGMGRHEAYEPLSVRWVHSEKSAADFGYEAAAAYYESLLERCHPSNREEIEKRLHQAQAGKGETLFEKITALIQRMDTGHDCTLTLE